MKRRELIRAMGTIGAATLTSAATAGLATDAVAKTSNAK